MRTTMSEEFLSVTHALKRMHEHAVQIEFDLARCRAESKKQKRMIVNLMKMVSGQTVREDDVHELREYAELLDKEINGDESNRKGV